MELKEWLGENNVLGQEVWERKYQYNDETLDEFFDRVSGGNEEIKKLMQERKFLFGGRILANRGIPDKHTLSNCYVIPSPEDNLESIFDCAKSMARTYSLGGGVGVDISKLAPKGARVANAAKTSSGAVSFMELYDTTTGLIGQNGRRGALMLAMNIDHPDIEEFITSKDDTDKINNANISVKITDYFMESLVLDDSYTHEFYRPESNEIIVKRTSPQELFRKLCYQTWKNGEPGILFWDKICNQGMLAYDKEFEYECVNPCFSGDMELLTSEGYKSFEELCGTRPYIRNINGDIVRSKVWCSGDKDTVKLIMGDGSNIVCTPNHVFLLDNWETCEARHLKYKYVRTYCGGRNYVQDVVENGIRPVYDFTEPDTHWGVVNGVIVHNCSELPLPAGGSCLLGAINLSEFVKHPFTEDAVFDYEAFTDAVTIAVRAMNEVLDEGKDLHPLEIQRQSVEDWRQIGLGIFGLADCLIKMGLIYGEYNANMFCSGLSFTMFRTALKASDDLGGEIGSYHKYNANAINSSPIVQSTGLVTTHLANSNLLTIAPTGTLSTMFNVSGGIEPMFATKYTRTTKSLHGHDVTYDVFPKVVKEYMDYYDLTDIDDLGAAFVTARQIPWEHRIDCQAAWQEHIDAAISSTVNLPNEATVEDVMDIYMRAWSKKLKGITVYREGCEREGILKTEDAKTSSQNTSQKLSEAQNSVKYDSVIPKSRKQIGTTHGDTFCKKCACGTLYITLNRDDDGNVVESFVQTSKGGICQANIGAVNRMVSVALRSGTKVSEIVDQLKGINCPACVKLMSKGTALDGISCADILGKTLEEFANQEKCVKTPTETVEKCEKVRKSLLNQLECPDCGSPLEHIGGCVTCVSCGYSKCNA